MPPFHLKPPITQPQSAGVEKLLTGNLPPLLSVRKLVSLHASVLRSESRRSVVSATLAVVH